ncbi:hypothetical protein [Micromonospora carbonacea]|uniref:hypothetical protein n=1 Tax=Micromonospora carbonacea TaxID=47853 RepID=UPI003D7148B9
MRNVFHCSDRCANVCILPSLANALNEMENQHGKNEWPCKAGEDGDSYGQI